MAFQVPVTATAPGLSPGPRVYLYRGPGELGMSWLFLSEGL